MYSSIHENGIVEHEGITRKIQNKNFNAYCKIICSRTNIRVTINTERDETFPEKIESIEVIDTDRKSIYYLIDLSKYQESQTILNKSKRFIITSYEAKYIITSSDSVNIDSISYVGITFDKLQNWIGDTSEKALKALRSKITDKNHDYLTEYSDLLDDNVEVEIGYIRRHESSYTKLIKTISPVISLKIDKPIHFKQTISLIQKTMTSIAMFSGINLNITDITLFYKDKHEYHTGSSLYSTLINENPNNREQYFWTNIAPGFRSPQLPDNTFSTFFSLNDEFYNNCVAFNRYKSFQNENEKFLGLYRIVENYAKQLQQPLLPDKQLKTLLDSIDTTLRDNIYKINSKQKRGFLKKIEQHNYNFSNTASLMKKLWESNPTGLHQLKPNTLDFNRCAEIRNKISHGIHFDITHSEMRMVTTFYEIFAFILLASKIYKDNLTLIEIIKRKSGTNVLLKGDSQ